MILSNELLNQVYISYSVRRAASGVKNKQRIEIFCNIYPPTYIKGVKQCRQQIRFMLNSFKNEFNE